MRRYRDPVTLTVCEKCDGLIMPSSRYVGWCTYCNANRKFYTRPNEAYTTHTTTRRRDFAQATGKDINNTRLYTRGDK